MRRSSSGSSVRITVGEPSTAARRARGRPRPKPRISSIQVTTASHGVDASSTRHEELLFPRNQLNLVWALRRVLSGLSSTDGGNAAALELLIDRMKTFRTNDEFLAEVAKNRLAAG